MREGPAIGFKTSIVMSNNVAPSILWLVCGGDGKVGGAGRALGGRGPHCAALCEGIDN